MSDRTYSIFKLSIGGFFDGYWTLDISKNSNGFCASYFNSYYRESSQRDFVVSDSQIKKLEHQLEMSNVEKWYCHYSNAQILDGVGWDFTSKGIEYEGSNAFPKGFDGLLAFLAAEFNCPDFAIREGYEAIFPDEMNGIGHIAAYAYVPGNVDEYVERLLHDLVVLTREQHCYEDCQSILESHGIPFNLNSIVEHDMSTANDKLIIAAMVAIAKIDAFDGRNDNFKECSKNGTFASWLKRLKRYQ